MISTRRARQSLTAVAAGMLAVACSTASVASAAVPQELTVVSPDKIQLTSGGTMKATVVVLNGGDAASVAFRVDADNSIAVTPATAAVAANNVTRIPVTFKPAKSSISKASGQLIATASNRPPSAVPFELSPKAASPSRARPKRCNRTQPERLANLIDGCQVRCHSRSRRVGHSHCSRNAEREAWDQRSPSPYLQSVTLGHPAFARPSRQVTR